MSNVADQSPRARRFSIENHENERISVEMAKYPNFICSPLTPQRRAIVSILRRKDTKKSDFVFYSDRLIRLLIEDSLNEFPFRKCEVVTAVDDMTCTGVEFSEKICGVSIVRAGESMEAGLRAVCQGVRIGKILIQRNEETLEPVLIYSKVPKDIGSRKVLLMDPMLATGGSAIRAIDVLVEKYGVKEENIVFCNLVCVPVGLEAVFSKYPNIKIVSCCLDTGLTSRGYIYPGFGDFGDRYFGTTD